MAARAPCKDRASEKSGGLIFLFPEVLRERWELAFSEFDCGSQIDVDRSKRRCIFVGWRPAIIGLKVFFVPCAGRLASPIFQRWMTLSIYRWIALPKALWFSNPCTASSFTAPRVTSRWNPNDPPQNALGTPTNSLNPFWISHVDAGQRSPSSVCRLVLTSFHPLTM